jgi:hypothetical protein
MGIYRDYENVYALQERMEFLIFKRSHLRLMGKLTVEQDYDIEQEIMELKDRINYAYQDEEEFL